MTTLFETEPLVAEPHAAGTIATPPVDFGTIRWQTEDASGVTWLCENLAGWADTPESDTPFPQRTFNHGAWAGLGWYAERHLVLTGVILAPDRALLQKSLHALRAQHYASLAAVVTLAVFEVDGTKLLAVRAASPHLSVEYLGPNAARVSYEMVAPWPVKQTSVRRADTSAAGTSVGRHYPRPTVDGDFRVYGMSAATGNLFLTNAGNAPVWPRFVITGAVVNPRIHAPNQNKKLGFTITLGSADQLGIDSNLHSVVLNQTGNRRYVLTTDSSWFALLPGQNLIQYRSDSGGGSLTVFYNDGWW